MPDPDSEPVYILEKPVIARKRMDELSTNMQEGRRIHQKLQELGSATAKQLADATGYSRKRIDQHLKWAVDDGYAKVKNF